MGATAKRTKKAVGAANAAPTPSHARAGRALPIRSSPVTTAPSLRAKLSALKPPARRAAPATARAKPKIPPFARNPVLQELEPRLLMSADLNPLAHDTLLASPALGGAEFRSLADTGTPTVVTTAAVAPIQRTNELVFVDTATPDYQALIDAMREGAQGAGRHLEFVLIDAERDGIRRITDTLAKKSDLDAIHIVSHASDGAVQLGSSKLDFETLVKRAAAVKRWGEALTAAGDILFYGCDLAASAEGKSLMEAMSRLTGADVAASEDPTGSAAKGGDWELEFKAGAIEARTVAPAAGESEWDHLLAVPTFVAAGTADDAANAISPGLPAGLAVNDILLLFVETANQAAAITNQNGGVWTEVTNSPQGTGTAAAIDATRLTVFWSRYNGTQGAPTVGDSGNHQLGRIYAFRGVTTTGNPFNISSGSNEGTSDTSLSATGASTTVADTLVVIGATISMELGTENFGGTWTNASLANIQVRDNLLGTGGNDGRLAVVTGEKATAGAYGATTNTLTAGSEKGMLTIALAPDTTPYTISGTVRNDVDGDAVVGEGGEGTFRNVTVRLYQDDGDGVIEATDAWVQDTTTNASGQYSFTATFGNYWVVVDSKTIGSALDVAYNGGFGIGDVWAEQTYGDDWTTGGAPDPGARYGGVNAATSDDASALLSSDHVARATVSGANVAGVDYGFTFSAIVNTRGNNTDDDGAGTGRRQQGSLRQFILNANAIAGTQTSEFQIGAVGSTQTITPTGTSLQNITDAVNLNAWTQGAAAYSGPPLVVLDGNNLGGNGLTLTASADGSTIRGFVVRDFGGDGIRIESGSTGNVIAGNYVGRLTTGGADAGAGEENGADGIGVRGNGNTIGGTGANDGNVISGNAANGVLVSGASGNVILGNRVGTNALGTLAIGNGTGGLPAGEDGIRLLSSNGNTIGGSSVAARNLVSGNLGDGIYLDNSDSNAILGNYSGLNAAGTGAIANSLSGISLGSGSDNNVIGGTGANDGNVASGNSQWGVWLFGSSGNTFLGNRIGTNAAGTADLGNTNEGMLLQAGSDNNTIGGTAAGAGNLVSGNDGGGILLNGSDGNVILGNSIGTSASGLIDLGNGSGGGGDGIGLDDSASNTIGGTSAAARNLISGNNGIGVSIEGALATGNVVSGNWLGVAADGTTAMRNDNVGIRIGYGAASNTIGGTAAGAGNLAANNQWGGIEQLNGAGLAGLGNAVLGNVSYANNGNPGIRLQNFPGNDGGKTAGEPALYMDTPVFTSASLAGTLLTVSGRIGTTAADTDFANSRVEIFKSNAAGDGIVYLGFLTSNLANGDFSGTIDVTGSGLVTGNTLTGTATDPTNNTSQYGANFALPITISGTVYHDVDGDADVAEGGTLAFAGATVRLYADNAVVGTITAGDTVLQTTTTDASGNYSFTVANGNYWVAVDSSTLTSGALYNGVYNSSWIWAEQTWGDDSTSAGLDVAARYGGRSATTNDAQIAGNATGSEHVARVNVSGGAAVAGVNYGFSFNAIVNVTDDPVGVAGNRTVQGSLRQFLINANAITNASFGIQASEFQIGAVGSTQTIIPTVTSLPAITDAVTLNAWTQGAAGYTGPPLVVLDGNNLGGDGLTLTATADGSTIRGFVVRDFGNSGIRIDNGSDSNVIAGNYVGRLDTAGADAGAAEANGGYGIDVLGANNTIGGAAAADRNVVSGNTMNGIYLSGAGATGNRVEGNRIGTNAAGTGAVGNLQDGVYSALGAAGTTIIGNLIAGNVGDGIELTGASAGNVIRGNTIGDAVGTPALANGRFGIVLYNGVNGTQIGGTNPVDANVISGNVSSGIVIDGAGGAATTGNVIAGNLIGTDAAGTTDRGNGASGIEIFNGANGNTIGGTAAGAGNVISGNNQYGVSISGATASGNVVRQNLIGTRADGTGSIGNGWQGIAIVGSPNNRIGGTAATAGNVIANSGFDGIAVTGATATGNSFLGNVYRDNGGLGIDVVDNGPNNTPALGQDVGDADLGANNLQNFPVLTSAVPSGGNTTIVGTLNSTLGTTFRIEFYSSPAGTEDPTGYGEGRVYLGATTVITNGLGNAAISATLPVSVAAGTRVTATATVDLGGGNYGDTSEFALNVIAGAAISGTVYEDVNGDASLADGVGRDGVDVFLYRDGGDQVADGVDDVLVGSTVTAGGGNWSFGALPDARYWVVVDSRDVTASAGAAVPANVWAEQTHGDNWATDALDLAARYGGRNAAVSDNAAALATAEHVARVVVAGASVSGVDSGFSFSAIVNTRGDSLDEDGVGGGRLHQGSLRQFILNSNSVNGTQTSAFAIAGAGVQTINLAAALPDINGAVVLDAWSEGVFQGTPGYSGPPLIELNGSGTATYGLHLISGSGGSTIRGFVINRFTLDGIGIDFSDGNTVQGNYIGTNAAGTLTAGFANGDDGIDLDNGSSGNTIGGTAASQRNVISGNADCGIVINGLGVDGNVVLGNYIGTDAAGVNDRGNSQQGVQIRIGAANNTIGGAAAGARNVISGNNQNGVFIRGDAGTGNLVLGNYIGTDAGGTLDVGNSLDGVQILGAGNAIGGAAAGEGNVISGNNRYGVHVFGGDSNVVRGNLVGTAANGTGNLANSGSGVVVRTDVANGAQNNTIGGAAAGEGNVIGFNLNGVSVEGAGTTGNVFQGNRIGTDASGTLNLGNSEEGLEIYAGASGNTVGGTAAGAGNTIANNGFGGSNWDGIWIGGTSTGNRILGNSIYGNAGLGIDLNGDGVNPPDGATNGTLPNIDMDTVGSMTAALGGTTLTLAGYVGNMPASPTFAGARVEFFVSDNDASGWGEGRTYLGFLTANGSSQFSGNLTVAGVNVGDEITATATDAAGNTSEFSLQVTVVGSGGISGTLYHDADADADVTEGEGTFAGATVNLWLDNGGTAGAIDAGDTFVTSTTTNASGVYGFSGLANATYYVLVDSKTLSADGNVWAEQTYAAANTASGAGFTALAGALYGGRSATVSDNAAALTSAEHVTKVAISGATVANVDAGFSYNVVVNVRGDGADDDGGGTGRHSQGTLDQFVLNANNVAGPNAMRFVPAVATNAAGGGGNWWQIGLAAALPQITGAGTTIDGTAYQAVVNGAVRNDNAGVLGTGGTVGVDAIALGQVARPELELVDGAGVAYGLDVNGATATITKLAIHGFDTADIHVGDVAGTTITANVIGTSASSFTDPVANRSRAGIYVQEGDGGTIQGNLIGYTQRQGIWLQTVGGDTTDNWLVQGNELRGNDAPGAATLDDAIDVDGGTTGSQFVGNLIAGNRNAGLDLYQGATNVLVQNNTISGNAASATEQWGIRISTPGAGTVVDRNVVTANTGVGIQIEGGGTGAVRVIGNQVTANTAGGVQITSSNGHTIGGTGAGEGNTIANNAGHGIGFSSVTAGLVQGNTITGNFDSAPLPPDVGAGVSIEGSSNVTVGGTAAGARNVISGNQRQGVFIGYNAANNWVAGNYLGTDATGTVAQANGHSGVLLYFNADNNTIGGTSAAARNLISGNGVGVWIEESSDNNVVSGNYIGTDASGAADLGNGSAGVIVNLNSQGNRIGGALGGERNVISGSGSSGVLIQNGANGTIVQGNYIGTNAAGTAALQNDGGGVGINNSANVTIGGAAAGAGNLISGHTTQAGVGLWGGSIGAVIQGNRIGTDATGTVALGNRNGVSFGGGAWNGLVGGTGAGEGNLIAHSTFNGVEIYAGSTGVSVLGNSIHSNGLLGINLVDAGDAPTGVTANDAGDGDGGANRLQNFPVLATANVIGPNITIAGTLDSTLGGSFRLEFFASSAADPSGYGEGERYLGFLNVTDGGMNDTDGIANGTIVFSTTLVPAQAVLGGEAVSATATALATGDTSEFAANRVANTAPVNTVPATASVNEDTLFAFTGANQISVADGQANLVQVVLTVTNGTLSAAGPGTVVGSGTASVTLTGTYANINASLATLAYQGTLNFNGADTLTVVATDAGGMSDTDACAITVNAVNDAPSASAPASYAATEQVSLSLAGTGLVVADVDAGAAGVTVTLSVVSGTLSAGAGATGVGVAGSGSATLTLTGSVAQINNLLLGNAGATLAYLINSDTPPATDTLTLSINDGGNTGAGGALNGSANSTLNITALNDAPVNAVPVSIAVTEDVASALTGISIADVDAGAGSVLVTLSVPTGTLAALAAGGVAVGGSGSGTLTLTGTVANINAFIAAANVSFTTALNDTAAVTLTVTTDDQGNTPAPALNDVDTVTLNVTAVNDAPANTVPAAQATSEDTALVFSTGNGNQVLAADLDAGASLVDVTLTVTNGTLTLAGTAGLAFQAGANATATMTVRGTLADINTAMNGMSYAPTANYTGAASLTITTDDRGFTGAGGALNDSDVVGITVNAVNDAPAGTDATVTLAEDGFHVFAAAEFGFADPSDVPANAFFAVRIASLPALGTLTNNAVALNVGDFVSAADIGAGLLRYTPPANANGAGYASFTFQVQDNGGTLLGGVDLDASPNAITLDVTAVNDAPSASAPASYNATEQTLLDLAGTLSVADVDAGAGSVTVTVSVVSGQINAAAGGSGAAVAGSGTASVTLTGTLAQIGNLLAGNLGATITYFHPTDTPPATDTLTLSINDGGNTGAGGAQIAAANSTINLAAVNDGPAATAPAAYAATEQVVLSLASPFLTVFDVDAGAVSVTATVSVVSGTLNATAGATGVTIGGGGTGTLTLTGTVAQLNNLLTGGGGSTLTYVIASDTPPATDTLTLSINDGGNTGSGGALNASANSTINITALNDAPSNTVPVAQATNEDTALVFSAGNGNQVLAADLDAGASLVDVTLTVTNGTLTLAGTAGLAFQAGANGTATMTVRGTLADINTAMNGMSYAPTANYTGPASLTITTDDRGFTGAGGALNDSDVVGITVNAVNDAPAGTDATVTLAEDGFHVFAAAAFGFADPSDVPANAFLAVRIASLPALGTLTNNAVALNVGDFVSAADIGAGLMRYTPPANANGAGYASFTFQVQDNGGTLLGGVDLDASPNTITLDVTAVNDAPTATIVPAAYAATEQVGLTLHGTGLSVADIDAAAAGLTATLSVVAGTLTVGTGTTGVGVAGSGTNSVTLTGTLAQINDLLAGGNGGSVAYLIASDTPPASDTLTLAINDGGNTGAGGALAGNDTATINITALNDAPVNAVPGAIAVTEDVASALTGISIADVDAGAGSVLVTLSVPSGTLAAVTAGGVTVGGSGSGTLTLSGTVGNINAFIAASNVSFTTALNDASSVTLTVTTDDQGNTPAPALNDVDMVTLNVTAVNDAPSNTVPVAQATNEDTALVFSAGNGNQVLAADLDAGASLVDVTLTVTNGTLTLAGTAGLAFQAGANGTATMTVRGTLADINTAMNGMSYAPTTNYTGAASLTITTDDRGFTGAGGALNDSDVVGITVNAVNDAPAGTDATVTLAEDGFHVFAAAEFGFADPSDVPANAFFAVRIASLPALGTLTNNAVALNVGDFVSAADIGAGLLRYTPPANANGAGYASFTFQVRDNGGTLLGGIDLDATPNTITLDVTAVNDAPVNTVPASIGVTEDVASPLTGISIADLDAGAGSVLVTLSVPTGTLAALSSGGVTVVGSGSGTLTLTGAVANINAFIAAANVSFITALNNTAAVTLTVTTDDQGNSPAPALNDSDTVTLNVTAVNDAPAGTDATVTLAEDGFHVFAAAELGFADPADVPANAFFAVRIASLPALGTLTNNAVALNVGDFVSAADIGAGLMRYTPPANANGAGYASFTFQVQDNGGTLLGGVDLDASPNTITLDVTAVNDAPANTVPVAQATNEDTALVFSAGNGNQVLAADLDAGASLVDVTLTVTNGTLTLAGTAGLAFQAGANGTATMTVRGTLADINTAMNGMSYAPTTNYTGAASLTITTDDRGFTGAGGALNDSDVVGITVNAVNDAPAGTDATVTLAEDGFHVFAAAEFGFADPSDVPANAFFAVRIASLPALGTLTNNAVALNVGDFVSAADIGAGLLRYTPPANANGAGYASFTFQVQDNGGTLLGGVDLDASPNAITLDVTAVNDAPSASAPAAYAATEQVSLNLAGTGLAVADVDAGAAGVTVTLSVVSGTLSAGAGATGVGIAGSGSATLTLTGSVAQINNLLLGNAGATLAYLIASDTPPATDTLTLSINDGGNTGAGGALNASANSTINISAVNDAPVNAVPGAIAVTEDVASALTGISIADVDAGAGSVLVTLSVPSGTLAAVTAGGVTVGGSGSGTLTLTGTVANLNAFIAAASVSFTTALNDTSSVTLTVTTDDQGNTPAPALNDVDTVTLNVTAVNDAPSNTVPVAQATNEDTALVFSAGNGNQVLAADLDAGASLVDVTLTVTNGTLTLAGTAGLAFQAGANATATMTVRGTLADINTAMNGMSYAPTGNYTGAASLTISTDDRGFTGAGGALNDSDVVGITVNAVNDAPVNTVPVAQATNEDTALVFSAGNGNQVLAADLDAGASLVDVTLTVTNGTLTLAGTAGLAFQAGADSSATMTVRGTLADINTAMNGMSYAPTANYTGAASLTISTDDRGFTGAGGALTDADGVAITVNAVNDAPVNTVPVAQATNEDTALVFSAGNGNQVLAADLDAGASLVDVTLTVTNGTLTLAGTAGLAFQAGANATATMTVRGTLADINTAMNGMSYAPTANYTGAASLTITTDDRGFTGAGGALNDSDVVGITVNAVNDAPAGTDATVTLAEDGFHVFAAAEFGFADPSDVPANAFLAVRIASLPALGTLTNNAVPLNVGDFVSAADIGAGLLRYTPPANANGAGYASFTFQVQDNGGTLLGGVDLDASPNTITLDVTAVNDAPANTVPVAQATNEDTALVFSAGNGNQVLAADLDAGASLVDVTLTVTNGTLTLAGTAGLAFQAGANATATMTVRGTLADINTAMNGMSYAPTANYTGAASLTITTDDRGFTGAGGALNDSDVVGITVNAVNDAPVNTVPVSIAVTEDVASALTGISIADVDAGAGSVLVTLSVPTGTLAALAAGGVAVGGSGSGTLTLTGTVGNINAFIAASSVSFTTALNDTSSVTLTVTTDDQGNSPAPAQTDVDTVTLNVTAINDTPVNTVPGPQVVNEDTPLTFSAAGGNAIAVADPDAATLQVTLTATNGVLTLASLAGLVFTTGDGAADATMTFTGTAADVNFALDGLAFLPSLDYSGPASVSILAEDLGQTGAGGALQDADLVNITVVAVNDAPVIGNRAFAITDGGAAGIGSPELSATDVDDAATSLVFTIGTVTNGYFEYIAAPGVAITGFTQQQVMNGEVRFVHDGSGIAPTATVYVTDGATGVGPYAISIAFTGGGGPITPPPPGGGGGGGGPVTVDPPAPLPPPQTPSAGGGTSAGDTYLRAPTSPLSDGGDDGQAEVAAAAAAPGASALQKVLAPDTGLPVGRAEGESVDAKPASSEVVEVEPIRAEMEVLPMRREVFDNPNDEERQKIEVIMSSVKVTGLAFSVGAVWWAVRAAGLVASLLASSPAWRHVDPLPVLGRDEEDEEEFDVAEEDKERKDDEHRAAWVLEERG